MGSSEREYDLVLFGATGYTGLYTAEYITKALPTNLRWAVSGRSEAKLQGVVDELKELNVDRAAPKIEVCSLELEALKSLARKTTVLINTVGPYHVYSTPVVQACAETGTHYLDVTGEVPWVYELVQKFDRTAKATNAIIIPQCGVESSPGDMLAFATAKKLRSASRQTGEVINSLEMATSPSGGTSETIFKIFDNYGLGAIANASKAGSLSASPLPPRSKPLLTRLFGVRRVPGLGLLTTHITASADVPIVYRSWSLLQKTSEAYGPNFAFRAYGKASNIVFGALMHYAIQFGTLILALAPLRWLLRRLLPKAGDGPSREAASKDKVHLSSVATADGTPLKQAFGEVQYNGSVYELTGLIVAEAAATILYADHIPARELGGGLFTPATLGDAYIDRLAKAGFAIQTRFMES